MARKKTITRGGAREGAGRPGAYGEETTTLTVRVPESKKDALKLIIQKQLKKWQN